jgi:hypothetical protein
MVVSSEGLVVVVDQVASDQVSEALVVVVLLTGSAGASCQPAAWTEATKAKDEIATAFILYMLTFLRD